MTNPADHDDTSPNDAPASEDDYPTDLASDLDEYGTIAPVGDFRPQAICFDSLVRGDQLGDFRIQRLLGCGSFGAVYLARELSLDRLVALKVAPPQGASSTVDEGRNLARLKHPHIVSVYGETTDRRTGCLLLSMQFVDGCNLAVLISQLYSDDPEHSWEQNTLLRLISPREHDVSLDGELPGSVETICVIGEKLASALEHAHQRGIVHRDIKPANILIDRDGTALLADFNVSDDQNDSNQTAGGTLAYMSPEQIELFTHRRSYDTVGPRSDQFSLGMVLWELACGQRPYQELETQCNGSSPRERLSHFLSLRQRELEINHQEIPIGLAMILKRAMQTDPRKRFASAAAMATALRGLAELQRARRGAFELNRAGHFARRNLTWFILIGGLLPHFAASGLQTAYNWTWIDEVKQMSNDDAFQSAFVAYNVVIYPLCIGWLVWNLYRFGSGYRLLAQRTPLARSQVRQLRKQVLNLPRQFMLAAAVGWFPGTLLFPLLISWFGGHMLPAQTWTHFFVSFAIAGMIATTYSYAIVMYIVVCHGYRSCWQIGARYQERARYELNGIQTRVRWLAILAGVLPLAAAALLLAIEMPVAEDFVGMTEQAIQQDVGALRNLMALVITLIVAGAVGLYVIEKASTWMMRTLRALTLSEN